MALTQGHLHAGSSSLQRCGAGMDDFPLSSIEDIRAALPVFKSAGVPLYVHAELALPGECSAEEGAPGECDADGEAAAAPGNYSAWLGTRPAAMEQAAVKLLIEALEADKSPAQPGFEIHVAHLADAGATLDMLKQAKEKGAYFCFAWFTGTAMQELLMMSANTQACPSRWRRARTSCCLRQRTSRTARRSTSARRPSGEHIIIIWS